MCVLPSIGECAIDFLPSMLEQWGDYICGWLADRDLDGIAYDMRLGMCPTTQLRDVH
jgi:hypothetical protein